MGSYRWALSRATTFMAGYNLIKGTSTLFLTTHEPSSSVQGRVDFLTRQILASKVYSNK